MLTYLEPTSDLYERERVVLDIIKKNPDKHHNRLISLIVPEYMAKTTFEKTKDSLLEKNIIAVVKKGNMKFYTPTLDYHTRFQQHVERITNTSFHNMKNHLKKLELSYQHKDVSEKIILANSLLKDLMQTDNGFTFLDANKNPKKTLYHDEHLEIQQMIHGLFTVVKNDKDYETIFPTIMSFFSSSMPKNYQEID